MKVYFTGSISGKEKFQVNYERVVSKLKKKGFEVLGDTVGASTEYVYEQISDDDKVEYYKRVLKWMGEADIIVCEASQPSLSIGHEISLGLEKGKPVVVLYSQGKSPHFLMGSSSSRLVVEKYTLDNLEEVLDACVDYAIDQQDTRFNFFISPKHQHFLDWVAKNKKIPRAVFLRRLIEEDMRNNDEYPG